MLATYRNIFIAIWRRVHYSSLLSSLVCFQLTIQSIINLSRYTMDHPISGRIRKPMTIGRILGLVPTLTIATQIIHSSTNLTHHLVVRFIIPTTMAML